MNSVRPILPSISDTERTPFIDALLEFIQWQSARIAGLGSEVESLKQTTKAISPKELTLFQDVSKYPI